MRQGYSEFQVRATAELKMLILTVGRTFCDLSSEGAFGGGNNPIGIVEVQEISVKLSVKSGLWIARFLDAIPAK
jgi:TPP-dependent 2-oxoacid decarboxylase